MQNTRPEMRIFQLLRDEDKSGVSGVGLVAVGVVFPSGKVGLEWLGRTALLNPEQTRRRRTYSRPWWQDPRDFHDGEWANSYERSFADVCESVSEGTRPSMSHFYCDHSSTGRASISKALDLARAS